MVRPYSISHRVLNQSPKSTMNLVFFFLIGLTFWSVEAIDLNEAREQKCTDLTPDVDMAWLGAQKVWYYPIWNLFEIYKFAADGHGVNWVQERTAHQIVKLGCSFWKPPSSTTFFGATVLYDTVVTPQEIIWRKEGESGVFRRFRYVFTDNKSFVLGTNCYEDNEASWIVLSPFSSLPSSTLEKIVWHIKSLGFKESNIVYNPASYCKDYAHPPPPPPSPSYYDN